MNKYEANFFYNNFDLMSLFLKTYLNLFIIINSYACLKYATMIQSGKNFKKT